jgi:hypothetical protein
MNVPDHIKLPFFAYGLFKPGQLCFFRIQDFVRSTVLAEVPGRLKERDGVPLLILNNDVMVKGVCIEFQDGFAQEAYERIAEISPIRFTNGLK